MVVDADLNVFAGKENGSMDKKISKIDPGILPMPAKTRVAAYARVSSGKDAMLHSLSAQVSYYSQLIQAHSDWEYAGVFADEALTGTKADRDGFQRLLAECRAGNIDLIITKSISRFARNTVTLLETVRELKSLGVDVYFEEQNIHTISANGELMLTILASYAQEESLSASENQKWRIRKSFEKGIPVDGTILGYRLVNGTYIIKPDEAEVVRSIFADYLSGMGKEAIMKKLNTAGITTRNGNRWSPSCIHRVLHNYTYTGNLLLQKTFRENHITKKTLPNHGELPQYLVKHTHEPIVSMETFLAAQDEAERRSKKRSGATSKNEYPFTSLIVCAHCGKHYRRKITRGGPVWICSTYNVYGKSACPSKQIPEGALEKAAAEVLGLGAFDAESLHNKITAIRAEGNNTLIFLFRDGTQTVKQWADRSRAESWTPEMKARAAEIARKGKK